MDPLLDQPYCCLSQCSIRRAGDESMAHDITNEDCQGRISFENRPPTAESASPPLGGPPFDDLPAVSGRWSVVATLRRLYSDLSRFGRAPARFDEAELAGVNAAVIHRAMFARSRTTRSATSTCSSFLSSVSATSRTRRHASSRSRSFRRGNRLGPADRCESAPVCRAPAYRRRRRR